MEWSILVEFISSLPVPAALVFELLLIIGCFVYLRSADMSLQASLRSQRKIFEEFTKQAEEEFAPKEGLNDMKTEMSALRREIRDNNNQLRTEIKESFLSTNNNISQFYNTIINVLSKGRSL